MDQPDAPSVDPAQQRPATSGVRFGCLKESAAHPAADRRGPGSIAGDILYGADAIAAFIYGERRFRRAVYNLVENGRIPHFRLGAAICARKSVLLGWIEGQERKASFEGEP